MTEYNLPTTPYPHYDLNGDRCSLPGIPVIDRQAAEKLPGANKILKKMIGI